MHGVIKSINDIFGAVNPEDRVLRMIRHTPLDARTLRACFSSDMYIDATTALLVSEGEMTLCINRKLVRIAAAAAVVLSVSHLCHVESCSEDFRGVSLMVGEEFMTEMDSTDMIYRRIRYGVRLYSNPVIELARDEAAMVAERLGEVGRAIENGGHLYRREVILNRLFAFYLDLSDIIDRRHAVPVSKHAARYESIVKQFMELLAACYRTEHNVGFYASQLNISAHYLTLIVREVTGRSVSDFIFGMLYGDARAMLSESKMSVQEITAALNFSDQSAFGKFFKRRSGISPLDYRRKSALM